MFIYIPFRVPQLVYKQIFLRPFPLAFSIHPANAGFVKGDKKKIIVFKMKRKMKVKIRRRKIKKSEVLEQGRYRPPQKGINAHLAQKLDV